jgi:putative ABC transport system permease protein
MVSGSVQDLKHSARMLVKNPGFTCVAIVSIAIGVGANAAMFSMADALVLRPLPVPRPGEVMTVAAAPPVQGLRNPAMSYRDYLDVREGSRSFDRLAAYQLVAVAFATSKDELAQRKVGVAASENLLEATGVTPRLGRWFRADENEVVGRNPVIVLAYDTWTDLFGGDPNLVDRRVRLSGIDFTVIGVGPEGFSGLDPYVRPSFFVPLAMVPSLNTSAPPDALERRDFRWLSVKGRLKSGITMTQARQDVASVADALEQQYPDSNRGLGFTVQTELQARTTDSADTLLVTVLMTLSFAVLLVACANVAGLIASRAPARARELALRLAMGAGRTRVIRQLLTESMLLSLVGGVFGLGLAYGGIVLFRQIDIPTDLPAALTFELDRRVLIVATTVAVASALLSSLLPAWRATRGDLAATLKDASGSMPRRSPLWTRHGLVCGQVALSLVLVTVSLWLFRGTRLLVANGPGYRTEQLLMVNLDPTLARYNDAKAREFFREVTENTRALPGVVSVALTSDIPLGTDTRDIVTVAPEGYQFPAGSDSITVQGARVDEGFFATMDIDIVSGRGFTSADTTDTPQVAIVNTTFANRYWPGQSALGKRIRVKDSSDSWVQIVGIAATVHYNWVAEGPTEYIYLHRLQHPAPTPRTTMLVHTLGEAAALAAPIREVVRGIDASIPVFSVRTMEGFYRARAITTSNVIVGAVAGMGLMGLLLALVGLYALMAHAVSQRTREIGIRMAVGARPGNVLQMVLRHGALLSIAGIALGLAAAAAMNNLLRVAFPVSSGVNLGLFLFVVPALLAVTLVSALIPAQRAARIDPLMALKQD